MIKVSNLTSSKGNKVANQFEIRVNNDVYFQSYNSIICHIDSTNKVYLDKYYWNYSRTTTKYLCLFLRESSSEIREKVDREIYELVNLNK